MKFKTIFSRLILTYVLITILAIAILSVVISYVYQNYIFEEKRKSLESVASKVVSMTEDFYQGEIKIEELNIAINAMGYSTNSMVYVLKINPADFKIEDLKLKGLEEVITQQDMEKILAGEKIYNKKKYSKDFETDVLIVGYPLVVSNEVKGAVIVFCPENNLNKYITQMDLKIWLSALIVFLLSLIPIYFNARKISKPIKDMDMVLRKIANGEAVEENIIKSNDEIGRLSESFWEMQRQLEKTEIMRRELIANVSHELRTPLTSMNGFVQGMLDGIIPEEKYREYLELMKEENQRLIRLTSEILEIAKTQSEEINKC
jgi:methyl-accepting chemotaxis protein